MANSYDHPCWTCSRVSAHGHISNKRNNQKHKIQGINFNQTTHSSKLCYDKHRKHNRDINTHKIKFKPHSPKRNIKHKPSMMYSYNYHKRGIMKLCHNKSEAPNDKFKKLMRYFHTKFQSLKHTGGQ